MRQRRRLSTVSIGQGPIPAASCTLPLRHEDLRPLHCHPGSNNRVRSPRKLFRLEPGRSLYFVALTGDFNRTVFRLASTAQPSEYTVLGER